MYELPIEILFGDMSRKIDDKIYAATVNVGINVDRDELVRALQYDRGQYEKGYVDGIIDLLRRLRDKATLDSSLLWKVNYEEVVGIVREMIGWEI